MRKLNLIPYTRFFSHGFSCHGLVYGMNVMLYKRILDAHDQALKINSYLRRFPNLPQ